MHISYITGLATFLFVWFACAPLLRGIKGGSAFSLGQAGFIGIEAQLPFVATTQGGLASLVLPLFIAGAAAGFLKKRIFGIRQRLLP